jgi:1-acyl-sn-glycerol-3-phosphate acyltransferase
MALDTLKQQPSLPDPRDKKRYAFGQTPVRRVITPLAKGVFHLFSDWEASGIEYLPLQGPVVLASNHVTNYDVFYMQFVLPRLIFFMGKAELFRNPILDAVLRSLGGFPVERGARDEWAIQHALQVLEHDQVLGIFPEGKRNHGRGLHPGRTGAARLAIAVQCPVVPMAVGGTELLFRGSLRRQHITVRLGPPIHPRPYESQLSLTDRTMFAIAALLPRGQRGVYAQHPPGF